MSRERVLSLLREQQGEYLSGEAMSRTLGISRAGVWKAIEALRQEGYVIASAPNRGYLLEEAPDKLRAGELAGPLSDCLVGSRLLCLDVVDSTNTECKRQAMAGAAEGLLVTAEEQTGGRGRRGRSFQSPKGKGLYLSALFRPNLEPSKTADFTAWVAVAVCDGIEACCGVRPKIKWTNDIILGGKKLVGILTELGLESESNALDYLVTGIGINVNETPEDFSPEVREIATSLSQELGRPVRRTQLCAHIALALDRMYAGYPRDKEAYLAKYRADCITPGHQVQLITPATRRQAFALEIDDDFNLVVELHNGRRETISSGEVSVRGMYGYV
ncbi:biotin--[acetyl-CoA-carboxylase] ligase [Pseudoflavonifractor sp. 60]|uniref:biotin--[acetyl-CoA-carboxylase] ligase n=1 Tax=Pseudoflavonifractor sp. 60 TaxID=2304576 RepID=UPI001369E579|nr:biotin--[acetyl-CoA-carboxylase] ligase [Pseudoflavonifractor sp. 60]NBI66919.1 biotin--[acetyl-CoA-carboxylase] ligase [Pseudoflavonifractor sp. 60]